MTNKKPGDNPTAADALKEDTETSLHEQVFGSDPDGFVNDTPQGAIGENVNHGFQRRPARPQPAAAPHRRQRPGRLPAGRRPPPLDTAPRQQGHSRAGASRE